MDALNAIFFTLVFLGYFYSVWWHVTYINITVEGPGGKLQFLTFWDELLQTFYYGVCVLNAFVGSSIGPAGDPRKRSSLQKFRDYLHSSLVFPVGSFVVITFWAIYAIDRELVFPSILDKFIPTWLNHVMHTFVLPILLVDKYLNYHHLPSTRSGMMGLLIFAITYLLWILWIAYYAEIWVYPILRVLETHHRIIFFAVLLCFFISLYILGVSITKFLWRKEKAMGSAQKSKAAKSNKSNKSNKSKKAH